MSYYLIKPNILGASWKQTLGSLNMNFDSAGLYCKQM